MPYRVDDPNLPDAVKRLSTRQRRRWVRIWNAVYERCIARGGSDCEGEAFRQANGAAL